MKIINSIVSFALAALVLLASSSFYVSSHSCGGRINKIAFLEKADGCGHSLMPPCHKALMKDCCEDESIIHEAQDLKSEAALTATPLLPAYVLPEVTVLLAEVIPVSLIATNSYLHYDTPLRSCDLSLAHRVFLI